jgi:hypothetical protein
MLSVVLGFILSLCLLMILSAAMDHIKSTLVLGQLEDNTDLEVADASARDDAADTSSTFDQDVRRGIPIKGREDHKNYEMEAEGYEDMHDFETSEGDSADSEAEARRKATKVAAAADLAFEFGPSIIVKCRAREMEKLNYFAKCDGRAP